MPSVLKRMVVRLEEAADTLRQSASGNPNAYEKVWFAALPWTEHCADLAHPLSERWILRGNGRRHREARDIVAELDAYLAARALLSEALASSSSSQFVERLRAGCAIVGCPVGMDLRTTPIGLAPDADVTMVQFGHGDAVADRLAELFEDYRSTDLPPAYRAVAAMCVLLNIHPFVDANGRCARALFNAALSADEPSGLAYYVPLRAALDASNGGFEIRLRDAETHGNWAPLIGYFTTVFHILSNAHAAECATHRSCG